MCAQTGITAIAGGLLAHEIGKSSKEKREQEKQHVFRERETIPAFVPIAVRGWRFSIDAEYLKNYFRRFQDRTVTITFRDAIDRGFTPSVVCKNVNLAFSDKNTFSIKETRTPDPYGDIPFLAQGRRDGKEVVELLAFPSDENYSQIKCVEQEERSAFFKEKNYFADALSYPVQHGDENEYEEQRLFYAEKPLYNEATEKLPERLYEKINALIAPFRSLTPMTPRRPFKPVYIYHDPDVYNALYHTEGECVAMTDAYFVNPRYVDEGFQALYHECAHAMIARIQSIEELLLPLHEVSSVYKQLSDLGEYYNTHGVPRSPWDIFDESNYVGYKEDTAGHPWSDYNELFASALTVFRFFPDAFIERARVLPNAEQKIASRAVHSIGGLFKKIAESNGSNPEKAIAGLIPEYETLIDAIKKLPR
ncbi:MAG: hypothetical protein HY564_03350 [Candidatus Jacksonbacteria bacterium]|nr:hypothetical protein [Candidatus Jacksonbacteria bacterium]